MWLVATVVGKNALSLSRRFYLGSPRWPSPRSGRPWSVAMEQGVLPTTLHFPYPPLHPPEWLMIWTWSCSWENVGREQSGSWGGPTMGQEPWALDPASDVVRVPAHLSGPGGCWSG